MSANRKAIESHKMPSKTANYFNTFNHRLAKFGMSNDYGLIFSDNCFWRSMATLLSSGNGCTFKIRAYTAICKNKCEMFVCRPAYPNVLKYRTN